MIAERFLSMTSAYSLTAAPVLANRQVGAAERRAFTPMLIGFYFSFRSVIVLIAVRLLLLEPQTGAAAALGCDYLLLVFVAFQTAGQARHPLAWMLKISSFRWTLAYLGFAGCSLAWSGAVSLPVSFFYWLGVAADVAIVVLMLRAGEIETVAHSVMEGFIWSTCLLALVAWIMPLETDLRLGDLEYFNTNQIGNLCAFSILLAQYLMRRTHEKWQVPVLLLLVTLVRSLSKTTLAAFLVSEGFLLFRDKTMRRATKLLICALVIVVGLSFWGLYESYYDVYTTAGNQAETLTGRTAIWAYALNAAVMKPWFGNGFDALWKVMPPFGPDQFEARHAENELLQQFFAYGVVGVVLLIGVYGSLYRKARRLSQDSVRTILYTLLLFIVVRGMAEAEPFDLLLPLWSVTLFSLIVHGLIRRDRMGPQAGRGCGL